MATVYGIVKQNGGFINIYSELGKGSIFTIYLPRYVGKTEQVQQGSVTEEALGGSETILLVEDELAILKLATTMLKEYGYTVLAANAPNEAIRLANEHIGEIQLLITDVIMPEMNGRDLAKRLASCCPHIKHLFMSAYTSDAIAHNGMLDDGVCFIEKPFSTQNLAAKVRAALDSQ